MRRITAVVLVGLETEADTPLEAVRVALEDEIGMFVPRAAGAVVRSVLVERVSEQGGS